MSKIELAFEQCNTLMPLFVYVSESGHIQSAGDTFLKLFPREVIGAKFFEVLEVSRPKSVCCTQNLRELVGLKLHFRCRKDSSTQFTGLVVPAADGMGMLVNLSFGISVIDAVRNYDLTSGDFSPTDLAIEMLYLVEAKGLAMAEVFALNERLQSEKEAAEEQAATDGLTGLNNRRSLELHLSYFIENRVPFALANMDLDYFKKVNDSFGHAAGDHVLIRVADILREETRADDILARVGGDEFILLFKGLVNRDRLNELAARLIRRIQEPIVFEGNSCNISCSLGSTLTDLYRAPTIREMLRDADAALYASKAKGRACHTLFSSETGRV